MERSSLWTLDTENEASAKARAARVHFASSTSPTQSIPTDTCRCSASRWRPKHPATACRMSRSRCRPCGLEPPGACGFATGSGSALSAVAESAKGKGRFHWFDLCLGHYWDTAAVRHWNRYAISARILLRHGTQGASQAPGVPRYVHAQRVLSAAPERLSALRPSLFPGERSNDANPGRGKRVAGTRWAV